MPVNFERAVFTVARHRSGWAVEHDGEVLDTGPTREEVVASACRRARESTERGRPAQIRMGDEPGFRFR